MDKLQSAVMFACRCHEGQWREGDNPLPYACHPIEVMSLVRDVGRVHDDDLLCAAVLHDTVESGHEHSRELRALFGATVADLVSELTRREPGPDETLGLGKNEIWSLRSKILLEEVSQMSPAAQTIKLADRVSNFAEAKRNKSGRKMARYVAQTQEILAIVPKSANRGLWNRLARDVKGALDDL
ncbi:MAG: bifunctional (p)ppGpp synthetase/guanosine-3',5'-bis(diphosphate) 3'-pyrophosphohydrolase [Chthonomonadaceae bacterium]|nr:bifunctional (p)ppGpp synthetase/guanosine-3',5'-bis(diphosphate) 3'-pyrophosphohydrolase [Chthonomonadaceae bacterium]